MSSIVPYLTFRHGQASVDFLTSALGFDVVRRHDGDDEWTIGTYEPGQAW